MIAQYLNITTDELLYGKPNIKEVRRLNSIWDDLCENERIKVIKIIEIMKE